MLNQEEVVVIIPVLYDTYNELLALLESLSKQKDKEKIRVYVVDNSEIEPPQNFKSNIKKNNIYIKYLKPPKNLGYFGGAQYAFEYLLEEIILFKNIIVCNVDIEFSANFINKLVVKNWEANIGIIAPSIISKETGSDLNPKILNRYSINHIRFFKIVCMNYVTLNSYKFLSYLKKKIKGSKLRKNIQPKFIYAPHGSCIIFNKNYFEKGGNFRHISFLFGEEIFIGEFAINNNLKVIYDPELVIYDKENASTGFIYSRKICKYMKNSNLDIYNEYYS